MKFSFMVVFILLEREGEKIPSWTIINSQNSSQKDCFLLSNHFFSGFHFYSIADIESIPLVKYIAVAGRNVTLSCPGVNEHSLVDSLTWKTSITVAEFVNGLPLASNNRVSFFFSFLANQW